MQGGNQVAVHRLPPREEGENAALAPLRLDNTETGDENAIDKKRSIVLSVMFGVTYLNFGLSAMSASVLKPVVKFMKVRSRSPVIVT